MSRKKHRHISRKIVQLRPGLGSAQTRRPKVYVAFPLYSLEANFALINSAGGKIAATRKVRLKHYGSMAFTNEEPWGRWQTDEGKPLGCEGSVTNDQ